MRQFTRRACLAWQSAVLFVALLISLAPRCALSQPSAPINAANTADDTLYDVIVVGAGMAGVTAARRLRDLGVTNVLVLEARDRVGGRTYSVNTTTAGSIDLGAMWIHGADDGNPLYDLTAEDGPYRRSRLLNYISGAVYEGDGARLPTRDWIRTYAAMGTFRRGINEYQEAHAEDPADFPDLSIYDMYDFTMADLPETERPTANLQLHANYQVLLNGNVTDLSVLRYGDAKTLPAQDVFLYNGFDSLVGLQTPGLDIRLNSPVVEIDYSNPETVLVKSMGTEYRARYVVTTETLGCLKAKGINYVPPLPQEKQDAIDRMGFGVFDKSILVYDEAHWDAEDFIMETMPALSGRWKVYLNYDAVMDKPALVALNVADTARELEGQTDAQLMAELLAALRVIYPTLPDPVEFIQTRWYEDPFSRGAYSYYAVGNEKEITEVIGESVGRLYFAGEAASDKPGTVLGAYLSGLDRAEKIAGLRFSQSGSVSPSASSSNRAWSSSAVLVVVALLSISLRSALSQ